MKYKYSEIKREYTLEYIFNGEVITVTYDDDEQFIKDTFDFSTLQEGDEIADVNTDIPVKVIKSAEKVDGELKVILFKPYNLSRDERIEQYDIGNLPFSIDWQVV